MAPWIVLLAVAVIVVLALVVRGQLGSERTRHRRAERRYSKHWHDESTPRDDP